MSAARCDVCGGVGPFAPDSADVCARCQCADFGHAWQHVGPEIAEAPSAWIECFRLAELPLPRVLADAVGPSGLTATGCDECGGAGCYECCDGGRG